VEQERLFPRIPETVTTPAPVGVPNTRRSDARLCLPVRNQVEIVLRDLDSFVPKDHLARAIWKVVESCDLSAFYAPIKAVIGEPGHPATDPQVLVALWIYATAEGVGKARQLDRLCSEHDAYRWLRGGVPINYHLLSDFRVVHREALDDLMTKILAAMMAENLVSLDRVAQDGMRVRASAGAASFRREGTLMKLLAKAEAQVKCLSAQVDEPEEAKSAPSAQDLAARERAAPERQERLEHALKELPDAQAAKKTVKEKRDARVSMTDPEARVMKMPDGGYRPAYNVELATDTESQVIVGIAVINRGTDKDQASPMLAKIKEGVEKTPHG
jgi:transposase